MVPDGDEKRAQCSEDDCVLNFVTIELPKTRRNGLKCAGIATDS